MVTLSVLQRNLAYLCQSFSAYTLQKLPKSNKYNSYSLPFDLKRRFYYAIAGYMIQTFCFWCYIDNSVIRSGVWILNIPSTSVHASKPKIRICIRVHSKTAIWDLLSVPVCKVCHFHWTRELQLGYYRGNNGDEDSSYGNAVLLGTVHAVTSW